MVVDDNKDVPSALPCSCVCKHMRFRSPTTGVDGYEVARRMRQQPGMDKVLLAALLGLGGGLPDGCFLRDAHRKGNPMPIPPPN